MEPQKSQTCASSIGKQGNRLTRCPCKGDKFEIEIFEAKRQNAGISGTCQRMFATWTFISIGRRVTQVQKCAFCLRGESILFFECFKKIVLRVLKKTLGRILGIYDLQVYHANIHQIIHPFFFEASVPKCFRQSRGHRLKQGDAMTHATAESASETCQQRQQIPWALCCTRQERYHTPPPPTTPC